MIDYKEKNFISAVVYVHNSEKSIANFLASINKVFQDNFEKYELIFVNDASADHSIDKIRECTNNINNAVISIVNMSYYQGLEVSMNAGVDLAIGDFVFEFDFNTMDYEPQLIMDVYRKSLTGFDIVAASPNRSDKFTSKFFYKVFNTYSDVPNVLHTESFRILSRRVINRVQSVSKTIPYRKAIYACCGLKIANTFYSPNCVAISRTVDDDERMNLAVDSLILFTDIGYKLGIWLTCTMMCISAFTAIYALFMFLNRHPVEGWTSLVILLTFGFFGLFGILSIVIKYLSVILNLIFKKKEYMVESIMKVTK